MAGPWQTRAEFLIDEALERAQAAPDDIRLFRPSAVRPVQPSVRSEGTIQSILGVGRQMPSYRSWQSGIRVERNTVHDPIQSSQRNGMSSLGGV